MSLEIAFKRPYSNFYKFLSILYYLVLNIPKVRYLFNIHKIELLCLYNFLMAM